MILSWAIQDSVFARFIAFCFKAAKFLVCPWLVSLKKQVVKMPIYEYECPKCGKVFEEWGKAAESHKQEACPACQTPSPRIMSRTSFLLKGNGWYVSDYGYRKGISEDGAAPAPAKSSPVTPAKQGEKSLATKAPDKPGAGAAEKKTEKKTAAPASATSK